MDVKLFISAASVEFEDYREPLRDALTRPNVSVKIQEDFKANGETTLVKLDDYIRTCSAVIHLAGDACGGDAPATCVQALVARYPDLATKLPKLSRHVGDGAAPLSYTQWEAWIALYHGKGLFIAKPDASAPRAARHVRSEADVERQRVHLKTLGGEHRHAEIVFLHVYDLTAQLFGTSIFDWMLDAAVAARLAGDEVARAEFLAQQTYSGLPAPLFRHLWRQTGNRFDLLADLAIAVRAGTVESVAARLPIAADGEAHEAGHLRSAWHRVTQAQTWEPLARPLQLPLVRWQALAAIVADTDGRRDQPPSSGLLELLVWVMGPNKVVARDLAALAQLLWLATEAASREAAPTVRQAGATLLAALQQSAALQPHLARAQAGPTLPDEPLRLQVELSLSGSQPVLTRYWVQERPDTLNAVTEVPAGASLGAQLKAIVASAPRKHGRGLQVELMAPFELLCGEPEWTSYPKSVGFAGVPGLALARNFCDDWPVTWRWQERLRNVEDAEPESWREWAGEVVAKARDCAHLVCRFEHEPADDRAAHLVVLPFVPPSPRHASRNVVAFLEALLSGHPYMLWPGDESVVEAFKTTVRACVAGRHAAELPEALRQARKDGTLKHAVLFIDEPGPNPYDLMGGLETTGDLSIYT